MQHLAIDKAEKRGFVVIEIKSISKIKESQVKGMGFNGYRTQEILVIKKTEHDLDIKIEINKKKLSEEYVKEWRQTEESIRYFQEIVDQGFSLGAYENQELIGFVLLSYYGWNNSIWIENIRVSEKHQGKGIGEKLISSALEISRKKGARLLGLETQSTNYPAIQFYKKCKFDISGVDFSRYPQRENDIKQVAVLMKIDI